MQPENTTPALASLDRAATRLRHALGYLDEWHAQLTTETRSYVAAGHDALAAIDATVRALHDARAVLVARFRNPTDRILGLAGVIDDAEQASPTDDDEATS